MTARLEGAWQMEAVVWRAMPAPPTTWWEARRQAPLMVRAVC